MAQSYQIEKVSTETKSFTGKYGDMVSYQVKLREFDRPVELVQMAKTPKPKDLDELYGTIDISGQYGPKFKKEQKPGAGGFRGGGRPMGDSYAMFLSYSKDVAVKLLETEWDSKKFDDIMSSVSQGAHYLWGQRPGAAPEEGQQNRLASEPPLDNVVEPGDEPIDINSIPF